VGETRPRRVSAFGEQSGGGKAMTIGGCRSGKAMARPARRIEFGIDPPDIAVGTPIDEVEFAMRAVAEE